MTNDMSSNSAVPTPDSTVELRFGKEVAFGWETCPSASRWKSFEGPPLSAWSHWPSWRSQSIETRSQ